LLDVGGQGVDAAFAPGAAQRGGDAGLGQPRAGGRGWGDGQDRAGFGTGQVGDGALGEGGQEAGIKLAQQGP
jgi:hypothetical protein